MDEQFAIDVLSGRRRGVFPALLRTACSIGSWGYAAGIALRNAGYDRRWLTVHRVGVPVVSVGNLTTGGTGKTPVVAWCVQRLQREGMRPGILSRGYRSLPGQANDEALVLERLCPGAPHVQLRDRFAGAAIALEQHGCDALVLDDAFQHRRMQRDLDLVLIDATRPWGLGRLLPRGLLREPLSALKRADAVIVTRADQVDAANLSDLRYQIAMLRGLDEYIALRFTPQRLVNGLGEVQKPDLSEMPGFAAFCGIGNPDGFRRTLYELGFRGELRTFPDHHHYAKADFDALSQWMAAQGATALITTLKDLVKIPTEHALADRIWAVEIAVEFLVGERHLERRLVAALPRASARYAA